MIAFTEEHPTILIVDDDPHLRQVSKRLLLKAGYDVLEAATGEEALALVQQEHPTLVLLDIVLPDTHGLQVCQRIKANPIWSDTYVILLSGQSTSPDERAAGLESGADDYVVRPVANQELLARVRAGLRIRRVEEHLRWERDLLDRMMETSPVGITLVDCDGQITFANARAEEILGLSRDSLTQLRYNAPNLHITDFEGEPFPEEALPFTLVMTTGEPVYDVRHAIERADGERVLLSINSAPLRDTKGNITGMVSTIEDVTHRVFAERRRRARLKEELRALAGLASPTPTAITAAMFGTLPIREGYPQVFEELCRTYSDLIDRALAARLYKVSSEISDALRGVAQRLGALRAGPRDIVDLHSAALQAKVEDVNPRKAKVYVEEGHLVVLELMGYLALYYRNLAIHEPMGTHGSDTQPKKEEGGEDEG